MFDEKYLTKPDLQWLLIKPWLGYKLDSKMIKYLWRIVKEGKEKNKSAKGNLVGNISNSFSIVDKDNIFAGKFLPHLAEYYCKTYNYNIPNPPLVLDKNYNELKFLDSSISLQGFWANYQYKHEFNPIHNHTGFLSFVIWLKIPYDTKDQEKLPFLEGVKTEDKLAGKFQFTFTNIDGQLSQLPLEMNRDLEGQLLIFPSSLHHQVFPFFNTDEERVSISGNLSPVYRFDRA
tara:strand:- start:39 stop:734 length:696 start_codon:yes stop_codon:yes gene_type:complete